jgi:hypothetical protein
MKYYFHSGMNPHIRNPATIYYAFDRTRTVFDLPEIETITPIGELCTPKSIDELCYESAKRIIDNAKDGYMYVTWSGGIDSTLVLAELLKYAPKDQIVVLMNDYSVLEYQPFYEKYIKDQLVTKKFDFYTDNHIIDSIKDGIIVTGHLLDPVFGLGMYQHLPKQRLEQKIPDFLSKLDNYTKTKYNDLISACPRPLVNVKDFLWWFDYTLNYQPEQLMWLMEIDDLQLNKNLFHFGETKGWNDYAVSTDAEVKYPGTDYRNFKMPLKKQLYEFTKDDEYTREKIKVPSWRRYRQNEYEFPIYITTDWKREYGYLIDKKCPDTSKN